MQEKQSRRDFMKKGAAAGAAATFFRGASCEERALAQEAAKQTAALPAENASVSEQVDAVSGATRTSFALPDRAELKEKIPLSKIGGVTVSRIILGGNLIGGYAHSRDLFYVSDLIKAYHTQKKCIETFMIAEECGINAFLGDWNMGQMMADYWKWTDGKIQLIAQCPNDFDVVKRTIDSGAAAVYPNGETCDLLIAEEKFDVLEKFITLVRDAHLPVGLGAHRIETFRVALERGLVPDFWMKTFHPLGYWSARHPEEHDNVFCRRPDEPANLCGHVWNRGSRLKRSLPEPFCQAKAFGLPWKGAPTFCVSECMISKLSTMLISTPI